MNKSSLLVLHNYNDHANKLVLETAAKLDEQAFTTLLQPQPRLRAGAADTHAHHRVLLFSACRGQTCHVQAGSASPLH